MPPKVPYDCTRVYPRTTNLYQNTESYSMVHPLNNTHPCNKHMDYPPPVGVEKAVLLQCCASRGCDRKCLFRLLKTQEKKEK